MGIDSKNTDIIQSTDEDMKKVKASFKNIYFFFSKSEEWSQ